MSSLGKATLALGILTGAFVFSFAMAQIGTGDVPVSRNIENPISPLFVSSANSRDMTILYGKLEYLTHQLNLLQDKCGN